LTEALLKMNDGRGPDILAVGELESDRAAALLQNALNANFTDTNQHYQYRAMIEVKTGRHIATAVISRLPIVSARTALLDKRRRSLEVHLQAGDKELIVIASHWRSRMEQSGDDGEASRIEYASQIYDRFKSYYDKNPKVDFLVCGDFNDNPTDVSVRNHLHAVGEQTLVLQGGNQPLLLNLFAKDDWRKFGTLYYKEKGRPTPWNIFDQIVVSPGMLDNEGWSCNPDSAQTYQALVNPNDKLGRPWSFGKRTDDPKTRGYSDHFPVTVSLSVH
jgi:endonuclease/exonuclease/phosphatase family metal-dependent hydrolase